MTWIREVFWLHDWIFVYYFLCKLLEDNFRAVTKKTYSQLLVNKKLYRPAIKFNSTGIYKEKLT